MSILCLDFETANSTPYSACSIGLASFDDGGEVIARYEQLLLPHRHYRYFDPYNTAIHGIYAEDVASSPEFPDVADEIFEFLADSLVIAHNAAFDINVLNSLCQLYRIPIPDFHYFCTCKGARRMWPQLPNHKLNTLCDFIGHCFEHHQAGADSEAAGKVFFAMLEDSGGGTVSDLMAQLQITPGSFYRGAHSPCRCIPLRKKRKSSKT